MQCPSGYLAAMLSRNDGFNLHRFGVFPGFIMPLPKGVAFGRLPTNTKPPPWRPQAVLDPWPRQAETGPPAGIQAISRLNSLQLIHQPRLRLSSAADGPVTLFPSGNGDLICSE